MLLLLFATRFSESKSSDKMVRFIFVFLFSLTIFGQIYVAFFQYRVPNSNTTMFEVGDLESIYAAVKEMAENGNLTVSNSYFLRYPHQTFLVFELYVFTHILLLLGAKTVLLYPAFGLLAASGVCVAVLFFVAAVKIEKDQRTAWISGIVCLLIPSLRFSADQAYSHVLAYPYLYIGIYCMVKMRHADRMRGKALWGANCGACMGLASLMAGSSYIAIIAIFLFFLFTQTPKRFFFADGRFFTGYFYDNFRI
ncbi:MAG: hypothetical protein ACK5JF_01465 [Oscillospiraceae bacterium]